MAVTVNWADGLHYCIRSDVTIRITFDGVSGDLLDERIDILGIGTDIEALKADVLFV